MKNPLAGLMQQAQRMQENLQSIQEELASSEVLGESGGGLVKVRMTGKRQVVHLQIDPSLKEGAIDLLEDLVAAAFNDAVNKVRALKEDKMKALTGGVDLPMGLKLPF
jgi:DNA-binding YbaB/EbfC family protein